MLPIISIVYINFTYPTVDKFFVTAVAFMFSALVFNVLMRINIERTKRQTEHLEAFNKHLKLFGKDEDNSGLTYPSIIRDIIDEIDKLKDSQITKDVLLGDAEKPIKQEVNKKLKGKA